MSPDTQIKICGLTRHADAVVAAGAGAHFGGVILADGRRRLTSAETGSVFGDTSLTRVGVFVDQPVEQVLRAADVASLSVVQLHGDESPRYIAQIRSAWPGQIWKALRPRGEGEFLEGLDRYGSSVDGLLLDGWSAAARGGTGARFPWEQVAPARSSVPSDISLIVAGGLTAENVATAIQLLRPDVVDVSSGVESAPGIKEALAVHRFITAVREQSDGSAALHTE